MTKSQLQQFHHQIYQKYCRQMWIHSGLNEDEFYSYLGSKEVIIPPSTWTNPTEWSVFSLLHEIGHILTNTTQMKRCEQEFLATQWAIDEAKNIGFPLKKLYIDAYQSYIWEWRTNAIKHKAKKVPTIGQLTLQM